MSTANVGKRFQQDDIVMFPPVRKRENGMIVWRKERRIPQDDHRQTYKKHHNIREYKLNEVIPLVRNF